MMLIIKKRRISFFSRANDYEPYTPQKTYGHFEMEDKMFKVRKIIIVREILLREERAGLYASCALVCLSGMRYFLVFFFSPWCRTVQI